MIDRAGAAIKECGGVELACLSSALQFTWILSIPVICS